jgi:hypothetical protein
VRVRPRPSRRRACGRGPSRRRACGQGTSRRRAQGARPAAGPAVEPTAREGRSTVRPWPSRRRARGTRSTARGTRGGRQSRRGARGARPWLSPRRLRDERLWLSRRRARGVWPWRSRRRARGTRSTARGARDGRQSRRGARGVRPWPSRRGARGAVITRDGWVVFAATAAQGVACDVSVLVFPSFHFSFSSCSQLRNAALCVTAYSASRHRNDERDNATCYVAMRALEIRIDVTRAMATITIRQSPRPRPRPRRPRPSASATPPAARHKLYHVNRMWRCGRMFLR